MNTKVVDEALDSERFQVFDFKDNFCKGGGKDGDEDEASLSVWLATLQQTLEGIATCLCNVSKEVKIIQELVASTEEELNE